MQDLDRSCFNMATYNVEKELNNILTIPPVSRGKVIKSKFFKLLSRPDTTAFPL
jgi:hypothetical protein